MYISLAFLCLYGTTAESSFNMGNQGISNLTTYPVPANTLYFMFHNNLISDIPLGYFDSAPSLLTIYLQINQLKVIEKHMFAGLPDLQTLRLQQNQIHTIQPHSFKDNRALVELNLRHNSLQTLPESMFDPQNHPTALNEFIFDSNPLECESLCWVKQVDWLTVINPQWILCTGSGPLSGCRWNELKIQDLCGGRSSCTSDCLCFSWSLPNICFCPTNRSQTV